MLEYDQNLPQEFAHKPKRMGTGAMVVVLTLATVVLVYALVTLLPIIFRPPAIVIRKHHGILERADRA